MICSRECFDWIHFKYMKNDSNQNTRANERFLVLIKWHVAASSNSKLQASCYTIYYTLIYLDLIRNKKKKNNPKTNWCCISTSPPKWLKTLHRKDLNIKIKENNFEIETCWYDIILEKQPNRLIGVVSRHPQKIT